VIPEGCLGRQQIAGAADGFEGGHGSLSLNGMG